MKTSHVVSLSILWAALVAANVSPVLAETFSVDFLAAELADDDDGSFGSWTVGGYDDFSNFTAWGSAQHLDNWGSLLPASGNGPFFSGEFKGYGYDTPLAVPAMVINTTASALSPCCGISSYAPGEIFIHGWVGNDPDPLRHNQVVRYTAADSGFLTIDALFTQKHSGQIPWAVILDGTTIDGSTLTGQNSFKEFDNLGLVVNAGSILDFVIGGTASASFDATITLGPVPTDNAWGVDRTGDWNLATNWFPSAVPNSSNAVATFGAVITGITTVTTNTPVVAKQINFDNANSYIVAGGGSVNLEADAGNAALNVAQGTHEFQARVNLLSNTDAHIETGATLEFNNRLSLGGNTLTKTGGGSLLINNVLSTGGGSISLSAGVVGGGGSIAGSLANASGTVAPGDGAAGKLTVQGSYTQAASGSLAVELGGTAAGQYDVLQVGQTASLDGTLAVTLVNGFQPQSGNFFNVLSAGGSTLATSFATITGTDLGALSPGFKLNRITDASNVGLLAALPGDADLNKLTDFTDLGILLNRYNQSAGVGVAEWSKGDFNDDHQTDFTDLGILLNHYNQSVSLAAGSNAVPEPGSIVLALLGAAGLIVGGRSRAGRAC